MTVLEDAQDDWEDLWPGIPWPGNPLGRAIIMRTISMRLVARVYARIARENAEPMAFHVFRSWVEEYCTITA